MSVQDLQSLVAYLKEELSAQKDFIALLSLERDELIDEVEDLKEDLELATRLYGGAIGRLSLERQLSPLPFSGLSPR